MENFALRNLRVLKNRLLYTSVIILFLCSSTSGFGQSKNTKGLVVNEMVKVESMAITVTIDSAEELESTFKLDDLSKILNESGKNQTISFELICNGEKMSDGVKSHLSYKVQGNSDEPEEFLKRVEKVRIAAINYYNQQ
jgi:hypothetical protein